MTRYFNHTIQFFPLSLVLMVSAPYQRHIEKKRRAYRIRRPKTQRLRSIILLLKAPMRQRSVYLKEAYPSSAITTLPLIALASSRDIK